MGDYFKKKGLGQGFNLIYVSAICLGGNLNKKSFSFCNGKSHDNLPFWLYCISFLHDLWICGIKRPTNPVIMKEWNRILQNWKYSWLFSLQKKISFNSSVLQEKLLTQISNWSPWQNLSFEHSLPFGHFWVRTLTSADQCLLYVCPIRRLSSYNQLAHWQTWLLKTSTC